MTEFARDLAVQNWINQHWNWGDSDVRNTEALLEVLQGLNEDHRDKGLLLNALLTRIETMREIAYRQLRESTQNPRHVAVYRQRHGNGTAGVFYLPPAMDDSLVIEIDGKTAAIARSWAGVERYLGCGLGGLGYERVYEESENYGSDL